MTSVSQSQPISALHGADTEAAPSGPVRIQLKRTKGWKMPPNTVKVDRSTRWGNPFCAAAAIDYGFSTPSTVGAFVVDCFRQWIGPGPNADSLWMGPQSDAARVPFKDLSPLRGKNLACWCKIHVNGIPVPCHADVLLSLANDIPLEDVISENIRRAKGEAVR